MSTEKHNVNRRSFLKGLGLSSVMISAVGLGACSNNAASVSTQDETKKDNAMSKEPKEQKQSSWRVKPEPIKDIVETRDVDLVVVGAGNAGVVAAVTARQEGANVVLLEKSKRVQNAREAIGAVNSKLAPEHPMDVPELINHVSFSQAGDVNPLLYKTWAEKSGEMIEWMSETLKPKGFEFPFEYHAPDDPSAYYPPMCYNPVQGEYQPLGPNTGAYKHLEGLMEVYSELGGEVIFEAPVVELVQSSPGEKVEGAIAKVGDKYIQFNAKNGVILATGGYAGNDEMREELSPDTRFCVLNSAETETGDGIRLAMWAGGELESGGGSMIWNRGLIPDDGKPGDMTCGVIFLPGSQPFMHVNTLGKRFMNEDQVYPRSYSISATQPGHYSWIVWDKNYWEDMQKFDTCGCSRLVAAPAGSAFNSDVYNLEAFSKEHLDDFWLSKNIEKGHLKKADSLEELADQMGFSGETKNTFLAEVQRYNELYDKGVDEDFHKPMYRMSKVQDGPFYAGRIGGVLLISIHGVYTNEDSQVITKEGKPVEGLYVCGNDQGGFYPHGYPSNFTGINAGRTATFARIAAKHALNK